MPIAKSPLNSALGIWGRCPADSGARASHHAAVLPRHRPPGRCFTLKFFFGGLLICNDIFDQHDLILIQNLTPALPLASLGYDAS